MSADVSLTIPAEETAPSAAGVTTRSRWWARAQDYVALTRPRVLSLVLFTAPPAMVLGRDVWPSFGTLLGVLVGAALVGGGCGAINAWWEMDRDRQMLRTQDRPLPTGRLQPAQALTFGLVVSGLGLGSLYLAGGWPPLLIGLLTLAHYIFIYTLWLKPRSPQNIVIGGAAGAASPLIADAAASGEIGVYSLMLFAIVFFWTPPHFWAIALYRKDEYAAAGFPMMPNVVGNEATRRRMLVYAIGLVPVTLLPWFWGGLGPFYAATAVGAGALFIASILRAMRVRDPRQDRKVFAVSIVYLSAIFAEMLLELMIRS